MKDYLKVGEDKMPLVGLGLWKMPAPQTPQLICDAVEIGYRHIDSAADYGNEQQIGEGIAMAVAKNYCQRDELWITSKLWNTCHKPEHVALACDKTLQDLGLDYLDLYLIHFPISLKFVPFETRYPAEWIFDPLATEPKMEIEPVPLSNTWRAMEELVTCGKVKQIGVCNYNSGLLHDLMAYASIKPSMLQIESHPYLTQQPLLQLARDYGIATTAFSPLGALSYVALNMATLEESVLQQQLVRDIAADRHKSAAQIVLRWALQRGTAVIPKSASRARLKENIELFDFELNDQEMDSISSLDHGRRYNDPGVFCQQAFGRFYPIYD